MMQKFYATRGIMINGKEYNSGDIVYHNHEISGLKPCTEPAKRPSIPQKLAQNGFFCAKDPVISVIITFHNQMKFVDECLGGFKHQSIKFPYEVIAIVDKSDQGEAAYIQQNYPGVKVYSVSFGNANPSRNSGIDMASADIVTFFDGDDYPYGEYLEKMYKKLIENTDADFVYSRFDHELFGAEKGILPRCNIFEWSDSWTRFSPITNTPIMIWKDVCPRWDTQLKAFQDAAFGLTLVKNGLTGKHIREKLWHYRHHKEGSSYMPNYGEYRENEIKLMEKKFGLQIAPAECTFISLLCRDEVLDEYFEQIPTLGLPTATHWFIMVDSNDEKFIDKIKKYQRKYEKHFMSSRMFVTGETNEAYSRDFQIRGMRIANFIKIIINQAAERIGGSPLFFMVEDDTRAPKKAFKSLLPLMKDEKVAYASGIECGRGYSKHTGVCTLKEDDKGEIYERNIPQMRDKGIIEIAGGGWYAWIGRSRQMKDFIDHRPMRCVDGKMLGPDVMMVYDLVKYGYKALCDMSVQCDHYCPQAKEWLPAKIGVGYDITYYRRPSDNLWRMKMYRKDGTFFEMTQ